MKHRTLQIEGKDGLARIEEQLARSMFDWNCERIKKEYKGQPLGILRFGRWYDLVYEKENGAIGYLATCAVPA